MTPGTEPAAAEAAAAWPIPPGTILQHFPLIAGRRHEPRPQQVAAITQIDDAFRAGKRIAVLEMPTGGGKSPICLTFAEAMKSLGRKTHFLTIQKVLQDQYTRDFPAPQVEVMKGRSNYPCSHREGRGRDCSDAPCTDQKKGILRSCLTGLPVGVEGVITQAIAGEFGPDVHLCPYWKQLITCLLSPITLFNFSSFLFQQQIGRFGERDLMIIDEGHNMEGELLKFVSLELTEWALRIIDLAIDEDIRSKEQLVDWLRRKDVAGRIQRLLDKKPDELGFGDDEDVAGALDKAQNDALKELAQKLANFLAYLDMTEWVVETVDYTARNGRETRRKISARPLYAKDFAEDLLFSKGLRVLVMSATILDVGMWSKNLGLDPADVAHVCTPNEFPVDNRPIYLEYCGNMGHRYFAAAQNPKDPTEPKFTAKVRQILKRHEGQRGIIHSHSFKLSKVLEEQVASPRFLFQGQFPTKEEMLAEHARREDSVIVAPAMHEGVDLKDTLGRFQIICKVPWPDLQDKVMKERADRDQRYYALLTALKLVQSYGRIIRSKDDWGTTYLIDAGFESFSSRWGRELLPKWMRDALFKYAPAKIRRDP